MRLLISNDDGYLAPGLVALFEAVATLVDKEGKPLEVLVVAPEQDRSGASSSLTLDRPLSIKTARNGVFFVNGTPTDSVHMALTGILQKTPPDLVLSGINRGANMGDDTIYSGTVAAAIEGHLFGIPAMAFSWCTRHAKLATEPAHFKIAAQAAKQMVQSFIDGTLPSNFLLNINIPDINVAADKADATRLPYRVTRLGKRHKAEGVVPARDPRGEMVYWIGAAGPAQDAGEGTDFHAVELGFVSITPLMIDLTHYQALNDIKSRLTHLTNP